MLQEAEAQREMELGRGVGNGSSGAWVMKFFSCHTQANVFFSAVETEGAVVVPLGLPQRWESGAEWRGHRGIYTFWEKQLGF